MTLPRSREPQWTDQRTAPDLKFKDTRTVAGGRTRNLAGGPLQNLTHGSPTKFGSWAAQYLAVGPPSIFGRRPTPDSINAFAFIARKGT